MRAAAMTSIGCAREADDVPRAVAALSDEDEQVRIASATALADLGGDLAADALAARLASAAGEELRTVVRALGWLKDPRALAPARKLAHEYLGRSEARTFIDVVLNLGDERDRAELVAKAERVIAEAPQAVDLAVRELLGLLPSRPALADIPYLEPKAPRTVPRLSLGPHGTNVAQSRRPAAKFGGQPDWLMRPAWPVGADGRPMIFVGQLPIGERTAYLFVSGDENAGTWSPLGAGNAVVVQPGPPPHCPTTPEATGPSTYEFVRRDDLFGHPVTHRPVDLRLDPEPGLDPAVWEFQWPEGPSRDHHGDWNKIGGTPLFLQGDEKPPGDGWTFAAQFNASWAGREMGDGAECYVFLRDDGSGALLWQCH